MGVYVELFHGHHDADEQLDDFGFYGPILGPFPFFHMTYGCHFKTGEGKIIVNSKEIDFPEPDSNGFTEFLGAFYGDVSIFGAELIEEEKEIKHRWLRSQEIFMLRDIDMPKYINDPDEWVKHYASCKLKGLI